MVTLTVIAPSNLSAGFQFDVDVNGRTVQVTVPEGGVKAGEEIEVEDSFSIEGFGEAPHGKFRHALCDCCEVCPCPCLLSWIFPVCLLGQVMQRHKLNFIGMPTESRINKYTCFISIAIFAICLVLALTTNHLGTWATLICVYIAAIWFLVSMACTRVYMRKKYEIPAVLCAYDPLDDCLFTYFCVPCSLIQLHRHTPNETVQPYMLLSKTGLIHDSYETV